MVHTLEFSVLTIKNLRKLPKKVRERIINKLDFFVASETPLLFARPLINSEIGQYRFRIGYYRVIFDIQGEKIIVLTLGHRRDIYK